MGLPRPPGGAKGERVQWPEAWRSTNEIGARKARAKLSRSGPLAFAAAWADDQRSWLARAVGHALPLPLLLPLLLPHITLSARLTLTLFLTLTLTLTQP